MSDGRSGSAIVKVLRNRIDRREHIVGGGRLSASCRTAGDLMAETRRRYA